MNNTLINTLILIKAVEVGLELGLLAFGAYLLAKKVTWVQAKKEIRESAPILSVVFVTGFIITSIILNIF